MLVARLAVGVRWGDEGVASKKSAAVSSNWLNALRKKGGGQLTMLRQVYSHQIETIRVDFMML